MARHRVGRSQEFVADDGKRTAMMTLRQIAVANRTGRPVGICAVCSAHPVAIEAALRQGRRDGTMVLIEATPNQVNPSGGYSGLNPAGFVARVERIARCAGVAREQVLLGGDHLGPGPWAHEGAAPAMARARTLVADCVAAGFAKLHLDTSTACADDECPLPGELVATRAAELCRVAERTAAGTQTAAPLYVIGAEVPAPGGGASGAARDPVTGPDAAAGTVEAHRRAFKKAGLEAVWERVVALVVQPGVEFDNGAVRDYEPAATAPLSHFVTQVPNLVFEAHSTDYQTRAACAALVRGHFAILKVGPELTHAVREALFALCAIERALLPRRERAHLEAVCDRVMLDRPAHWQRHCGADGTVGRAARLYGFSDRIRYYWSDPDVGAAVETLYGNLSAMAIPLPLIAQYLPRQVEAVRAGALDPSPANLILDQALRVTQKYAQACGGR